MSRIFFQCASRHWRSATGLFARVFEPDTLTVTGGAVPVVQEVMRRNAAMYDFSDNGTLVYVTDTEAQDFGTLVWVDREGREEAIPIEPSAYAYPRISPDGQRVALDDRNAESDIWIWDFAGETRTRLTIGETGGRYPVWTPDGTPTKKTFRKSPVSRSKLTTPPLRSPA